MATQSATLQQYGNNPQAAFAARAGYAPQFSSPAVTQGSPAQAFPVQHASQYHGGFNGGGMGAGGNMMQQSGQTFQQNFTSAPYSQPTTTTTNNTHLPQPHHQTVRHSASPQQLQSPNAGSRAPQREQPTPPVKYPMAAPPLPHTPATHQQQQVPANNSNAGTPASPQSPGSQSREQQRIELLFEINIELLEEVNKLQSEGKGGAISDLQKAQLRKEGKSDKEASAEYVACLRRVQANLAYLMPKAQPQDPATQSKAPPGPAHMTAPQHMTQLEEKYQRLRELFPNWPGMDQRTAGSSASPRPQQTNGTTAPPAQA